MRSKSCCRGDPRSLNTARAYAFCSLKKLMTTGSFMFSKYRYGSVTDIPYFVTPTGRAGGIGGGVGKPAAASMPAAADGAASAIPATEPNDVRATKKATTTTRDM